MGKNIPISLVMLLFVALAGFLLAGCGSKKDEASQTQETARYVRRNENGGVQVEVTWIAPAYTEVIGNPASQYDPQKSFIFMIAMTTHSGNLLNYDFKQKAVLRVGSKELKAERWEYTSQDSHHPTGILLFNTPGSGDVEGPIQAKSVTLVLKDLNAVPERVFNWE